MRAQVKPEHNNPVIMADDQGDKVIITQDPRFLQILEIAENVAQSPATVLIQGESGTGKELLAAFIHHKSGRHGPYVAVNCAALPETLAESELFGHEKGAFTGALKKKPGKFELAHGGTIVLDEITELSMPLQAKLLRVLQEKMVDRVGGEKPVSVDFRLIAVSNKALHMAVAEEQFRQDLFYRLNVIPLEIPPLRERIRDVHLLATYFVDKYSRLYSRPEKVIDDAAMAAMLENGWPGNVRELENAMERAVLLSHMDTCISPSHLVINGLSGVPFASNITTPSTEIGTGSLKQMEKQLICRTLEDVNQNRTHAAERLGISIRTLRNKLNEYKQESLAAQKASSI